MLIHAKTVQFSEHWVYTHDTKCINGSFHKILMTLYADTALCIQFEPLVSHYIKATWHLNDINS